MRIDLRLTLKVVLLSVTIFVGYSAFDSSIWSVAPTRQHTERTSVIELSHNSAQDFILPGACSIYAKLESTRGMVVSSQEYDEGQRLSKMRRALLELLTAKEKIKIIQAQINELTALLSLDFEAKSKSILVEVDELRAEEKKLQLIVQQAQQKKQKIQRLLDGLNPGSVDTDSAKKSYLLFKLDFLQEKLKMVKKLQQGGSSTDSSGAVQKNYENLINLTNEQKNSLMAYINSLGGGDDQEKLKIEIADLQSYLRSQKVMLNDKNHCENLKKNIGMRLGQNKDIQELMEQLRQTKKRSIPNSLHCEGVAVKLKNEIKNTLSVINYAYSCSKGYNELQRSIQNNQELLKQLNDKLNAIKPQLQPKGLLEMIKETERSLKLKFKEVIDFKTVQYNNNGISITRESISAIDSEILVVKEQISHLKGGSTPTQPNNRELSQLIRELKALKLSYCVKREQYEHRAHKVWSHILWQEEQAKIYIRLAKKRAQYAQQLQKNEELFQDTRKELLNLVQSSK